MATNQSTSEISRERALRNWADPEHRARRLAARSARPSVEDRFWAAVEKSGDCWLWVGRRSGTYTVGGHHRRCQRAAWVFAHGGDDPRDKVIRARCGNDRCVNPAHLASVGRDERFNVIPLEVRFWSLVQKTDGCSWLGRIGWRGNFIMAVQSRRGCGCFIPATTHLVSGLTICPSATDVRTCWNAGRGAAVKSWNSANVGMCLLRPTRSGN